MKKVLINTLLIILFSLSIIFSLISLTILNDDYIKFVFDKKDIYSYIATSIENEYKKNNIEKDFDTEQVKKDVNDYISNRYEENNDNDLYYNQVFFMHNNKLRTVSYVIYVITIVLIMASGNIFLHSKKYHNLDTIFLISSIIIILISGCTYIFVDLSNYILNIVLNITNHILLGVGVFFLELVFLKYTNILIHKKTKGNS